MFLLQYKSCKKVTNAWNHPPRGRKLEKNAPRPDGTRPKMVVYDHQVFQPVLTITWWRSTTMLLPLLMDHNCQHVIASLGQGGPCRFSMLQQRTELDNKTLATKLKDLREAMVVVARTIPSKGDRIWLEYRLSPRGEAMYDVLLEFRDSLSKRKKMLASAAEQFEEVFEGHAAVT